MKSTNEAEFSVMHNKKFIVLTPCSIHTLPIHTLCINAKMHNLVNRKVSHGYHMTCHEVSDLQKAKVDLEVGKRERYEVISNSLHDRDIKLKIRVL